MIRSWSDSLMIAYERPTLNDQAIKKISQ